MFVNQVVIELTLLSTYLFMLCLKSMLKSKYTQHLLYTYALGGLIPPYLTFVPMGRISRELWEFRIM
jgi:hypothetical protein